MLEFYLCGDLRSDPRWAAGRPVLWRIYGYEISHSVSGGPTFHAEAEVVSPVGAVYIGGVAEGKDEEDALRNLEHVLKVKFGPDIIDHCRDLRLLSVLAR